MTSDQLSVCAAVSPVLDVLRRIASGVPLAVASVVEYAVLHRLPAIGKFVARLGEFRAVDPLEPLVLARAMSDEKSPREHATARGRRCRPLEVRAATRTFMRRLAQRATPCD